MLQWYLKPLIEVRAATERDYAAIARIQQRCPEAAQWPVGDYSGFRVLVAFAVTGRGGTAAGFCAWRQSTPEEAELLNLAVDPEWRRQGVAGALLGVLEREASGQLFLEVAEPNGPAIALYEHHGWVKTGMRNGYYEQGKINAIVMQKRPCYSPE